MKKELTKAEEQVMQILWKMEKTVVKDIVEEFEVPKPAYNTVSTIIRILEKKGFVDHEQQGKGYIYFPLISKKEYTKKYFRNFLSNYFQDSFKEMVSFFAKEDDMDIKELEQMLDEIKEDIKNENQNRKS